MLKHSARTASKPSDSMLLFKNFLQSATSRVAGVRDFLPLYADKRFFGLTIALALSITAAFYSADLVPNNIKSAGDLVLALASGNFSRDIRAAESRMPAALPAGLPSGETRIIITDIGVEAPVVFPGSTDLGTLNSALLKGVVHYPTSAAPDENGSILMFGHSTGLAVVHNQNFAVFNRLKDLKSGNVIRVRYGRREYWYKVTSVKIRKADEALINLGTEKKTLTLSTCRVFGAKDDRVVVESEFIKSYPLRSFDSASDSSS